MAGNALRFGSLFALAILVAAPVRASEVRKWVVENFQDFMEGELENVKITENGELRLGIETSKTADLPWPQVWAAAVDGDGAAYVTGGEGGEIRRAQPGKESSLLFKAAEPFVYALALRAKGRLWAATSPSGKIYDLSTNQQEQTNPATVFDPDEAFIWAMAAEKDGTAWVGVGSPARVYRVTAAGQASRVFESEEEHATRLLPLPDGSLLIGTTGKARVYRLRPDGAREVLLDSDRDEVRALALAEEPAPVSKGRGPVPTGRSSIYVALVEDRRAGSDASPTPVTPKTSSGDRSEDVLGEPAHSRARQWSPTRSPGKKNLVLRIDAEGFIQPVWEGDETPYALLSMGADVWVGLGRTKARIVEISGPQAVKSLLFQGREEEVVAFLPGSGGGGSFVTSHGSALYRWTSPPSSKGSFVSRSFDAGRVAIWGTSDWKTRPPAGRNDLDVSARCGNTERPDAAWTPWKSLENGAADCPPSRFFQWKIEIPRSKADVSVLQMRTHYRSKNAAPQIEDLTLKETRPGTLPGMGVGRGASAGSSAIPRATVGPLTGGQPPPFALRPEAEKASFLDVTWKAEDPDGDEVLFDVFMRGEEETVWKVLESDWPQSRYVWDTSVLPDGVYFLRITASDRPSNPRQEAQVTEIVSPPLEIDNTPPEIRDLKEQIKSAVVRIEFEAFDPTTPVEPAEYAVDTLQWERIEPVDQIADSPSERFVIVLPDLPDGEHTVFIKVRDQKENTATRKLVFKKGR